MSAVGVDGVRGGWLSASWIGSELRFALWRSIRELYRELRPSLITIDVPIGLPEQWETGGREVERTARARVGSRNKSLKSSVFPTAPRTVAAAFKKGRSFDELKRLSKQMFGKSISKQFYCILPKIIEIDDFILEDPKVRIVEVHPELCFEVIKGCGLSYTKRTRDGLAERRRLVATALQVDAHCLPGSLSQADLTAKEDDVLDAAVALWTASRVASGDAIRFPAEPPYDRLGLPMEMWA